MHVNNSRRRVLALTGAAATTTVAGCGGLVRSIGSSGASKDWPSFGHNPANTGYTSETSGPQETPEVRWQAEVSMSVVASPAVVDGIVYASSFDGNLYALDAETGDEEWRFETGGSLDSSPAVDDDRVFVGSRDGSLYAIGTDTGEEEWAYDPYDEPPGAEVDMAAASPTIAGGTVYCGSFVMEMNYLFALDAASGDERWRVETDGQHFYGPAVADGTVFSASDSALGAYDAESGENHWTVSDLLQVQTWSVIAEGVVYLGDGNRLLAVDAASGEIRWKADHKDKNIGVLTTPVAGPDGIYYGTANPHFSGTPSVLRRVDAAGEQQWSLELTDQVYVEASLAEDTLYVGTRPREGTTGAVHAIDAQTGERVWRLQTEGILAPPAIADGSVYVGTVGHNDEPGYVYAIE